MSDLKTLLQLLAERSERLASIPQGTSEHREAARRLEDTMREVSREMDARARNNYR